MKRVLRLTLLLMAVGVWGLVGPLWAVRAHQPVTRPLLIALGGGAGMSPYRLYLTALGSDFSRPLTAGFDDLMLVGEANGWVYFEGDYYHPNPTTGLYKNDGGLYRVNIINGHAQRLITHPDSGQQWWAYQSVLLPDGILYFLQDATTAYTRLYYARKDGTGSVALMPPDWDVIDTEVVQEGRDTWVIAQLYQGDNGPFLMRLAIPSGTALDLAPGSAWAALEAWLPQTQWLIYSDIDQLWKIRLDGSQRTALGPAERGYVVAWQEQTQLLVSELVSMVSTADPSVRYFLSGLSLVDGTVLWQLPQYEWGGFSPSGDWLAAYRNTYDPDTAASTGAVIERMHPDGKSRDVVWRPRRPMLNLTWADEHTLYYITADFALWRLTLTPRPRAKQVVKHVGEMSYTWSDDHHYIVTQTEWIEVATGQRGPLVQGDTTAVFAGWVKLATRHWSPVSLLILGGGLLIGGFYRGQGKAQP